MTIRSAGPQDYDRVWQLFKAVIDEKVFYPYDDRSTREEIEQSWINPKNIICVSEEDGVITGAYIVKPNQAGYGAHVANAAYMVDPAHRDKGIGKKLGLHSLETAREAGYRAMQYNLVVSTNKNAVHLWQSIGFEIIGTAPEAFYHFEEGFVDAYIMYRLL